MALRINAVVNMAQLRTKGIPTCAKVSENCRIPFLEHAFAFEKTDFTDVIGFEGSTFVPVEFSKWLFSK